MKTRRAYKLFSPQWAAARAFWLETSIASSNWPGKALWTEWSQFPSRLAMEFAVLYLT